jgi:hypothetical protein
MLKKENVCDVEGTMSTSEATSWSVRHLSIKKRSINKPFSSVKCRHDSDTVEGQHCNDKDSEKG